MSLRDLKIKTGVVKRCVLRLGLECLIQWLTDHLPLGTELARNCRSTSKSCRNSRLELTDSLPRVPTFMTSANRYFFLSEAHTHGSHKGLKTEVLKETQDIFPDVRRRLQTSHAELSELVDFISVCSALLEL